MATLSDWRRGNHLPREASDLPTVVLQLSRWAGHSALSRTHWRGLLAAATPTGRPWLAGDKLAPSGRSSAIALLGDLLTEAFAEEDVRLDAVCLSGQVQSIAIGRPITAVHTGEVSPRRVSVRVLLPSRDIQLAFPIAVSSTNSEDDSLHHRWLAQRNAHG